MKQSPLKRKTRLKPKTVSSRRKPMKRSQPRRDWTAARAKVEAEGRQCRICGQGPAEAAHVIGREHDRGRTCSSCKGSGVDPVLLKFTFPPHLADKDGRIPGQRSRAECRKCGGTGTTQVLHVNPDHVIPLCHQHHTAYDAHSLDILSSLTREEQVEATRLVGLENARRRTAPGEYERSDSA